MSKTNIDNYRIACILYDSMIGLSRTLVCERHKISLDTLMKYEERYSTMWVLRMYQEVKDSGFLEDYIL